MKTSLEVFFVFDIVSLVKPNTKSVYFKFSVAAIAAYALILVYSRSYVLNAIKNSSSHAMTVPLYIVATLCIATAGLMWFKSSKPNASVLKQVLVFVITPFALAPVLAIIYVYVVMLPIYSLASNL